METNRGHLSDEMLERHADRDLRGAEAVAVERHLHTCAACRSRLAEWESLFLQMAALPQFAPSPAFADRVMARIAAQAPAQAGAARAPVVLAWARRLWPAAAAAAALWTVAVGGALAWIFRQAELGPVELVRWAVGRLQEGFWTLLVRAAGAVNLPAVEVNLTGLLAFLAFLTLLAFWGARVLVRYATPATKARSYA